MVYNFMIFSLICMGIALFLFKELEDRFLFHFFLTWCTAGFILFIFVTTPGLREAVQVPSPLMLLVDYFWKMPVVSVSVLLNVVSGFFIFFNLGFLLIVSLYFGTNQTKTQHYINLLVLELCLFMVAWSVVGIENYLRVEVLFSTYYFSIAYALTDSIRRQFSAVAYILHFYIFYSVMLYGLYHIPELSMIFNSAPSIFQDILLKPAKTFEGAWVAWLFALSLSSELALSRIAHLFPKDQIVLFFPSKKPLIPSEVIPLEIIFLAAMFVKLWGYFWLSAVILVGFYT